MGALYVGDSGKVLRVNAGFDLSANTELSLTFTKPDGTQVVKLTADGVAIGLADTTDPDLGQLVQNEYVTYTIETGLIDSEGLWQVYLTYTDTTSDPDDIYIGSSAEFSVVAPAAASSLTTDYASAFYNSYFTLAQIDNKVLSLGATRDISSWTSKTSEEKVQTITYVTEEMDNYVYKGVLSSLVVAPGMQWPRSGVTYQNGLTIPDTVNPAFLLTYIASRSVEVSDNLIPRSKTVALNIKRQKLGDLEQEYYNRKDAQPSQDAKKTPSFAILQPYLLTGSTGNSVILQRG